MHPAHMRKPRQAMRVENEEEERSDTSTMPGGYRFSGPAPSKKADTQRQHRGNVLVQDEEEDLEDIDSRPAPSRRADRQRQLRRHEFERLDPAEDRATKGSLDCALTVVSRLFAAGALLGFLLAFLLGRFECLVTIRESACIVPESAS